jgi:aminoglycoside phosphotransferase (APT) family kinase protein
VYDVGTGRVLRRYRVPIDVAAEVRLMQHLAASGYPVPEVYDADGQDMVMERLDGPDLLADLGRRPWLIRRHARTLADLHDRLHKITAPPDLRAAIGPGGAVFDPGSVVLHMDLHPANVMLTGRGPVVIDWVGARSGPAGADVAMAYVIMTTSDTDLIPVYLRPVIKYLRTAFCRRFVASVQDSPWPHIARAARLRMTDVNVRPSEADRLLRLAERAEQADRVGAG